MAGTQERTGSGSTGIDKQALYGDYRDHERLRLWWQGRLHRKATHKALDIPDDEDMNISTSSTSGLGWKELLSIGTIGLVGIGLLLWGFTALTRPTAPTIVQPNPPHVFQQSPPVVNVPQGPAPVVNVQQDKTQLPNYRMTVE